MLVNLSLMCYLVLFGCVVVWGYDMRRVQFKDKTCVCGCMDVCLCLFVLVCR